MTHSQAPSVDREGFLYNPADWNRDLADTLASAEGIELTDAHWEVIDTLRQFYQDHDMPPANRIFVRTVRHHLGEEKGNSIYLMQLFGGSPAKIAAKIAGLPKPAGCL